MKHITIVFATTDEAVEFEELLQNEFISKDLNTECNSGMNSVSIKIVKKESVVVLECIAIVNNSLTNKN